MQLPDNATSCGLESALSLIFNVADCDCLDEGANLTVTVQLVFKVAAQLLVSVKAVAPLMEMLLISSGVLPLLVRVTVFVELVFSFCVPKFKLFALSLA